MPEVQKRMQAIDEQTKRVVEQVLGVQVQEDARDQRPPSALLESRLREDELRVAPPK
eukprot:CAMPEP_0115731850 /NCGR_PEP_ID=MMETSP0272-20121206/84803_1 /TAXON_ID=71861 /ORGANISM="Scrippsiella trochoidea, Strain CCMP3099" /LENGTH=56 /DNA_ID=CAMNT_0003175711 /DNA_START=104 /DNA_END=271 /DNA_ORIENTATION=+